MIVWTNQPYSVYEQLMATGSFSCTPALSSNLNDGFDDFARAYAWMIKQMNRHTMEQSIFYCGDAQAKGYYPTFAKRLWAEHNVHLNITEEDKREMREGKVDMYTFSYYMSNVVTTHESEDKVGGNFAAGVKNPYLNYSEWGWATDPLACNTTWK